MNMGDILGRNKRIDYGKSLMPDEGWRTSWAIGTTYSLDLEVLMSIPLALFQSKYLTDEIEDGVDNLRMDMLDALDKVKDRMFVFVHENNISAKCKNPKLVSFLDQNIWNFEPTDAFVSFHPKVWLVRYEKNTPNSNEYKYRLVVMSRNISSATDFDIAVAMDGVPDKKGNRKNNNMSLEAMMEGLMKKTGRDDIVEQFRKELQNVCFKAPAPFHTQVFWPHTFSDTFSEFKCPLLHENGIEKYDELMVISPFVHNVTLENLAKKVADKEKRILISRENELMKCDQKVLEHWQCYAMLGNYENCDVEVGDDESDVMNVALHAKIYIIKAQWKWGKKPCYNWFVGSTNCTEAGFGKNREALLQLKSYDESTSPNKVLESLKPFLIKYTPSDVKESVQDAGGGKEMRELVFDVSRLGYNVDLEQTGDKYKVTVSVDENERSKVVKDGVSITLSLFGHDSQKWELNKYDSHTFDNIDCSMLSSFARVEIKAFDETKTFLLKLPIKMSSDLLRARHKKIMSEIIGDEERMMGYIMHCLDPFAMPGKQIKKRNRTKHGSGNSDKGLYLLPIYEKLLVAASRNPQLLDDIDRNIELLKDTRDKDGQPLLSEDFNDMWEAFMSARKNG